MAIQFNSVGPAVVRALDGANVCPATVGACVVGALRTRHICWYCSWCTDGLLLGTAVGATDGLLLGTSVGATDGALLRE